MRCCTRCKLLRPVYLIGLLAAAQALVRATSADLVNTDFLDGYGDFEASHRVRWGSLYSQPGYDFAAHSIYVDPVNPAFPALRTGYSTPSPNNSVADGWIKFTGSETDPFNNAIFSVVPGGINGSKCQYIALTGLTSGAGEASIDIHCGVDANKPYMLHPGDKVTFAIDYIRMSDYSSLPTGTSVKYYMRIAGAAQAKELQPSSTPFSDSTTAVIPAGISDINLRVYIKTFGNLGGRTPGIYVDGAHLYVERAGQSTFERRQVPALTNRTVRTQNVFFSQGCTDIYGAARDYDALSTDETQLPNLCVLRKFNPGIKVYLYQSAATCAEKRDLEGKDRKIQNEGALTLLEAITDHPNWLYPDGQGGYIKWTGHDNWYHVRISDPAYQSLWAERVIERVVSLGYDGVWVDNLTSMTQAQHGIDRSPLEIQQFIHAVYPRLKAAGLRIVQNACDLHLRGVLNWAGVDGRIYLDPFWTPTPPFPASEGYTANSPATVADVFFQEYAFIIPRTTENYYSKTHWLDCLNDMDEVKRWNTAVNPDGSPKLKDNEKRQLYLWVTGRDFDGDPAYGVNGWINFGLCSYLLGHNEWTSIGFRVESSSGGVACISYPDVDYSITSRLGEPLGDHAAYNGDQYFRYRRYVPSASGGMGGVVVVNANTDAPRTFRLDFDGTDQQGNFVVNGQDVTIPPHSGRIYLKQKGPVLVRVRTPSEKVAPGEIITVAVDYLGTSDDTALGGALSARVPDEMAYVAGSAEASGGSYDAATNMVSWKIGNVAPGETGGRTFKARVK